MIRLRHAGKVERYRMGAINGNVFFSWGQKIDEKSRIRINEKRKILKLPENSLKMTKEKKYVAKWREKQVGELIK